MSRSVANRILSNGDPRASLVESSDIPSREDQCGIGDVRRSDNHGLRHYPGKFLGCLC